jgi:hypothetical protein
MAEPLTPLPGWESFYVIAGSSAAALTGLQFVVIALIADVPHEPTGDQIEAFGTPTIVHFCIALLISCALSAPWHSLSAPAVVLGAIGLFGLFYEAIVIRRARKQVGYTPVFEDWLWHAALPLVSYGTLIGAAIAMPVHSEVALFLVGAATLLLVFIGIHNAWDTVTFIALVYGRKREGSAP